MSLSAEDRSTPTVTWPVRIPRLREFERMKSTTFHYQGRKWLLRCAESDGFIYLWMYPKIHPPQDHVPFAISVWVQSEGSDIHGLSSTEEPQGDSSAIWEHKTSEVERILPGFRKDRLLNFRIDIKEHDPQRGCNSASAIAPHCPQFALHVITADASQQVTLTANSISCLDALSEDFSKMMDADSNLNVELRCQGYSTRAHKSVLCSRSPVFKMMLHSDMEEGRTGVVNIRDVDVDTFRQLLLYLYTGKLGEDMLTFDLAISLYEAADMYEIVSLKTFCSDFLRVQLTLDNAYDVLAIADAHADTRFVEVVKSYIVWEEVVQSTKANIIQDAGVASSTVEEKKESPYTSVSKTRFKFKGRTTARAHPYSKAACPNGTAAPLFTRAYYCPQPEKHRPKTFADASVQTSLTANSIPCLEALSEDFSKMLDSDSDFDVEILCLGHSTWAHGSVLCLRSPVLAKMLQRRTRRDGRTRVVKIREMDVDTFQQLLLYLYTGKLGENALTFDSAMSLYKAADAYGVVSLKTLCSDFLRAELTLDNAWRVSAAAEVCADSNFAAAVAAYVHDKLWCRPEKTPKPDITTKRLRRTH